MIVKLSENFRDRYEFARTHISRETILLQTSLICIMIVAFLIRFQAAFEFNWALSANDTYSQLLAANFIDTHITKVGIIGSIVAFFTYVDPIFWYPFPGIRNMGVTTHLGTPLTAVIVRRVFLLIGFNFTIEQAAFLAPAFCGSLSILVMYFLGKEISNKKVGLLSAFLLSFSPSFIQRTTSGFFDNEAVGILFMLLTFYLFLKALRTGSLIYSMFSGLALAGLYQSWGGSTYAVQLIALFVVIMVLLKKYSNRLMIAYAGTILPALSISVLVPSIGPPVLLDFTSGLIPLGVLGLLILISWYGSHKEELKNIPFLTQKNLELAGYAIIIGGILFLLLNFIFPIIPTFKSKFITVVVPFYRESSPLLSSVAEQAVQSWGEMFRSLFLIYFLIPLAIIYLYRKPTENNIFFITFLLTALYLSGSMARLIIILAPPAILAGAKAIDEILSPFAMIRQEKFFLSKRKRAVSVSVGREHVSIAFLVIFFIMAITLIQGLQVDNQIIQPASISLSVPTSTGGTRSFGDWYETFNWLNRETPASSVIVSWWDYGYWLSLSNRSTLVDGATLNSTQIGNVGAMLMSSPDVALKIASYYDVNYIVINLGNPSQGAFDNDIAKVQWMVKIAAANGNLATELGHPIVDKSFLNYAKDGKTVDSYGSAFYSSLFWALISNNQQPIAPSANTVQAIEGMHPVSATYSSYSEGFQSGYHEFNQIFQIVHITANNFVEIVKINWNLAEQLVGVNA